MLYYEILKLADDTNQLLLEKNNIYENNSVKEYELNWNFSLFVAKLLYKSDYKQFLNLDKLKEEITIFNEEWKANITYEKLIEYGFIYNVVNEIKLPGNLSHYCGKIFLSEDEKLKINSNKYYHELIFIGKLYNKYGDDDEALLKISIKDFDDLYNSFIVLYPNIIHKDDFLKKFSFITVEDYIYYCPRNFQDKDNYKIIAKLWNLFFQSGENAVSELEFKRFIHLIKLLFPGNISQVLPQEQQIAFEKNATNLLLKEEDLVSNKNSETKRIYFDSRMAFTELSHLRIEDLDYDLKLTNLFDFWKNEIYDKKGTGIFLEENSRREYLMMLYLILYSDNCNENIKRILTKSLNRPYITLNLINILNCNKPGTLLYLLDDKECRIFIYCNFLNLCCDQGNNSNCSEYQKQNIIVLIKKVFSLLLSNFSNRDANLENDIFNLLLFINETRFSKLCILLEDVYDFHIDLLAEKIGKYEVDIYKLRELVSSKKDSLINETNNFPITSIGILFDILKLFCNTNEKEKVVINKILEIYKSDFLEKTKIFCTNEYFYVEKIDWTKLFNNLIKDKSTYDLVKLIFEFITLPADNFETEHSNYDKIRITLDILCTAYDNKKINENVSDFLEELIIQLINKCYEIKTNIEDFEIFSLIIENTALGNNYSELFPKIVITINNFKDFRRQNFINIILEKGDFYLVFKMYNNLESIEDKKIIEDRIAKKDFRNCIEQIINVNDYMVVLENVCNSNISTDFEKELFDRFEEIIDQKKKKYINDSFMIKAEEFLLYRLYRIKDENSLKNYVFDNRLNPVCKKELEERKLFYQILLKEDTVSDYDWCVNKLQHLEKNNPENRQYSIFKIYYSILNLKNKQIDSTTEFNSLEKEIEKIINSGIVSYLLYWCKLYLLEKHSETEAKTFFYSLPNILQTEADFIEIILPDLQKRNLTNEILNLYGNINEKSKLTDAFKRIKNFISNSDSLLNQNIENYKNILMLSEDKRFMVIPPCINEHENTSGTYVLNEIVFVLKKILDKINMVKSLEVVNENAINDLVQIELNSRASMLRYKYEEQNRSGMSENGHDAGELDLKIDFVNYSMVIEALIYTSKGKLERHIMKCFKYDSSRNSLFSLIYYKNENNKFNSTWENIKKYIEEFKYPEGYDMSKSSDISDSYKNSSIKVLKVLHKNNLVFYHIMVNFSYADK